jgi:hypothetical protein
MTPQQAPPDAVVAVVALGRALDALIAALTSGSAADLLTTEAGLSRAIADVARVASIAACDQPQLRAELTRARATLHRCRVVGTAVAGAIDGCLAARGLSNTYDRAGSFRPGQVARTGRHSRI